MAYSNPAPTAGWTPNTTQASPQAVQPAIQQQQQNGQPPPQGTPQHQQYAPGQPAQQSPPNWSPQPPQNGYAPPRQQTQIAPISQPLQQGPTMQTLQPQHPDPYRSLPPPNAMYPQQYPGPPQQMGYAPQNQPAPRQRTAIACRYCRRRKIRCTGFDQSEDGRCTNCQRFSQECIFTPVSAQTQAFVPAHTVWRGQNPPPNTQLYGAFGQPLPQNGSRDAYPPQQQQPQQQQQQGQYPPPPQGYQQQPVYGQPQPGDKRPNDEPHTPTLPPPNPAITREGYAYPDPSSGVKINDLVAQNGYPTPEQGATPSEQNREANGDHMVRREPREVKDVGIQTDDIDLPSRPATIKEQAS